MDKQIRRDDRKASVSVSEVLAYPPLVPLWPEAGRALGMSRSVTYEMQQRDEFPVKILRVGRLHKVRRADLLRYLGISEPNVSAAVGGDAA